MKMSHALSAEWRKHPTWITLGLICGMPFGVVLLKTFAFLVRKESLVENQRFHWAAFLQTGHLEWTQMLVPLTLATWAVYVCWVENDGNAWKCLCIQPHGRAVTFFAKLGILWIWLILFLTVNTLVYLAAGSFLFPNQTAPVNKLILFNAFGLLFLGPVLHIQCWLAFRFANPMIPLAWCLVGNVIAILGSGTWLLFWPWAFSKSVGLISLAENLTTIAAALGLSLVILALSFFDFARRDIS